MRVGSAAQDDDSMQGFGDERGLWEQLELHPPWLILRRVSNIKPRYMHYPLFTIEPPLPWGRSLTLSEGSADRASSCCNVGVILAIAFDRRKQ